MARHLLIFSDLILSTQTLMKTWDIWQKPYICRSLSKRGHQIFYSLTSESCLLVCVQVHTLEVFQKELNESEHLVFQAVHSLQRALQGDYKDVVNMKESSRQRLEALREAAIKVSSGHSCRLHQSAVEVIWCIHRAVCNRHFFLLLLMNTFIFFPLSRSVVQVKKSTNCPLQALEAQNWFHELDIKASNMHFKQMRRKNFEITWWKNEVKLYES